MAVAVVVFDRLGRPGGECKAVYAGVVETLKTPQLRDARIVCAEPKAILDWSRRMETLKQLDSGLYVPGLSAAAEDQMREMVESPMMQYIMLSVFNAWAVNEGNHRTAWNSPVYAQLLLVQQMTMQGIDLIQQADGVPQSKGCAVTSMLARGVSLARLSCLSLDLGSFSDACSNLRMLLERDLTIRYVEAHNQYEDFAKAFYAEIYHGANERLNDEQLRESYAFGDWEECKRMMELIRTKYFDNRAPKKPGSYWKRPRTDQLADEFFEGTAWGSDDATRKKTLLVYDLGNRSVHPSLMDMIQPEESDLAPETLRGLILVTLGSLAMFGLSLFDELGPLVGQIEQVILHPPSTASLLDLVGAGATEY